VTSDQLLGLLLGPLGLTVGAMFVIWLLVTERLVPRGRLDEKELDRKEAVELLDKALSGYDGVTKAIEERNRLSRSLSEISGSSSPIRDQVEQTEQAIQRRRR
jgi:hypothetical protein